MFKTTLYFPSFDIFNQFRRKFTSRTIVLFPKINVLTAEITEQEIYLARKQYRATVIRKQRIDKVVVISPIGLKEAV